MQLFLRFMEIRTNCNYSLLYIERWVQKDLNKTEDKKTKQRKKILIATNHAYMLWQFRRELIAELNKEHEVILSLPFDEEQHEKPFQEMGIKCIDTPIERRGINPLTDFKLMKHYKKIFQDESPNLVITYSIKPNVYAGLICGKMGIPFCANVQGLGTAFQKAGLAQFVTLLYKLAFRKVRTVFFENEANAEEFQKRSIIPVKKQKILHGAGINLRRYPYQPYPENKKIHFLYLGRIMQEKGIDELFAAVRNLYAVRKDFVLDIVGFYEDNYKEQVESLVHEGIAVFHGFQENPVPYYTAADCIVLPSYHEGMSNVLLEAAAIGRPLITSNIPGCREAVNPGVSGILVKVKDTDSLQDAMETFLEKTYIDRALMGEAGRRRIEQIFDKRQVVKETINALGIG